MDLPWSASQKAYGLYLAIAASTIAVLFLEVNTEVGMAVGMLYVVPVTLALWTRNWRFPIYLALLLTPLIMLGFFLKPQGSPDVAVANRSTIITIVYFVSLLCANRLRVVAERNRAEENARSSEERHRTILETLGVG